MLKCSWSVIYPTVVRQSQKFLKFKFFQTYYAEILIIYQRFMAKMNWVGDMSKNTILVITDVMGFNFQNKYLKQIFLLKHSLRRASLHLWKTILNLMELINNRFSVQLLAQNTCQLIIFLLMSWKLNVMEDKIVCLNMTSHHPLLQNIIVFFCKYFHHFIWNKIPKEF